MAAKIGAHGIGIASDFFNFVTNTVKKIWLVDLFYLAYTYKHGDLLGLVHLIFFRCIIICMRYWYNSNIYIYK